MELDKSSKKIFIVSDDKLLLDMYVLKFKNEGFNAIPGFGSIDALEKLRGGIVPDAILLDVTAPVMSSLELLGVIRNEKLIPEAKAIILSSGNDQPSVEKGDTLGVAGYIPKTATMPSQIVQKVVAILDTVASTTH